MNLAGSHLWWKSVGARELRDHLLESCDPIGIADVPDAVDEYDSYLGPLAHHLRAGSGVGWLAFLLHEIRTNAMGLSPSPIRDFVAARRLRRWYDEAMADGASRP